MRRVDADAILESFRKLRRPADPNALRMVPLLSNAWIGIFGTGAPAVFFALTPRQPETRRTVTLGIEIIISERFEIVGATSRRSSRSGYAIALRDLGLIETFAAVIAHLASRLSADPRAYETELAVDRYFADWIRFFSFQALSQERAIGLWGELYVLSSLPNVERGVACWVGPYGQMFDFMGNGLSLEVKTSLRTAVASFSLAQIEGRDEGHTVLVRVLRDDVGGGSLDELVGDVRSQLKDPIQFDATLVRTGYRAGANAEMRLTAEDLRAVPNVKIPRPRITDPRIKAVRYELDIDGLSGEFVPVDPLLKRLAAKHSSSRRR
jgi:hypothetical protein